MKKSFTLGAIAGISSLALAIPVLAQVSGAQSVRSSAPAHTEMTRPAPTVANIQDRIDKDAAFLANADAINTLRKTVTQAHKDALTAALSITDDTQRQEAVKKAQEDMRAAIEAAITANPDLKEAMRFGGQGPGGRGEKMEGHGHGRMQDMLAQKLGMTADELKAELDSGKTIEQIAQDKGVTLPAHPVFGRGMHESEQEEDAQQ